MGNDGVGVVTASIGVTAVIPDLDGAISQDDLLRSADSALYQAKNGGRNCVMVRSIPLD